MEQNSEETSTTAGAEAPAAAAPRKRASRRVSAPAGEAVAETAPAAQPSAEAPAAETPAESKPARSASKSTAARRGSKAAAESADAEAAPAADAPAAETSAVDDPPKKRATRTRSKKPADAADATDAESAPAETGDATRQAAASNDADAPAGEAAPQKRNTRSRGKKPAAEAPADAPAVDQAADAAPEGAAAERRGQNGNGQNGNQRGGDQRGADNQTRSSRTRQRERKRRQGDDLEPEITEDDVLLPVAGILDVLDNYAFVRTSGYLPGTNDVYVSLGQVKKYGLRKGDAVVGAIRQPRDGDGGGRQKYNAIVKIDSVNSRPSDDTQVRPEFQALTPLSPEERLRLEGAPDQLARRVLDLFTPLGKGQRGIVAGPVRSGKSTLLEQIAAAISENHPEAHLMLVLIDERPEEVTRLQRSIDGEVIASTFDRPVEDHTTVAELSVERAKRLTELGHDVVVLIDSLSSLTRAYNLLVPAATRQPAGLVDAAAVVPVKRLLGAARNVENGGSLTIIAAAQSGTPADEVILDELLGTANLEVRLDRVLAEQQLFPAIELAASATRRDETFVGEAEARTVDGLRRTVAQRDSAESLAAVLQQLRDTASNVEFLALTQRTQSR